MHLFLFRILFQCTCPCLALFCWCVLYIQSLGFSAAPLHPHICDCILLGCWCFRTLMSQQGIKGRISWLQLCLVKARWIKPSVGIRERSALCTGIHRHCTEPNSLRLVFFSNAAYLWRLFQFSWLSSHSKNSSIIDVLSCTSGISVELRAGWLVAEACTCVWFAQHSPAVSCVLCWLVFSESSVWNETKWHWLQIQYGFILSIQSLK